MYCMHTTCISESYSDIFIIYISDSDDEIPLPIAVQPARGRGAQRRGRQPRRVHAQGRGRARGRRLHDRGAGDADPIHHRAVSVNGVDFEWGTYDWEDPYVSDWLPAFSGTRGVLVDTTDFNPVQYFKLFFPEEAFELISNETNRYAEQFFDKPQELPTSSRFHKWLDTDVEEIQAYIALQICMGMCQKNDLEEYWSKFWLTTTPFGEIMSRNRYEIITSFLHYANNEMDRPVRNDAEYDHLWKIRPLMQICEPRYLQVYGPRCELSIDESIVKFKGRVSFRQYLPAKPYKWGIKQFVLCESKTGYALRFLTYTGKGSLVPENGFTITESICLSLLDGFENRGHKVYTDNYYTSPSLYHELHSRNIGASGTVKAGRKGMPTAIHPHRLALIKGDAPVFMRANNMVACAWHDTKRVHFLSTTETNKTMDKRVRQRNADHGYRVVEKPVVAETYNQHMGGVDILDQKLVTYAYPHKSSKWYATIYHRIREVALVNGYILYCQDAGDEAVSPKVFRESVVSGLLENFQRRISRKGRPSVDKPNRLTESHFIGQYEDIKYKPDCVVCSSRTKPGWKRKQTNYKCKQCNLPMCFLPCHEIFHTKKNYHQEAARVIYDM